MAMGLKKLETMLKIRTEHEETGHLTRLHTEHISDSQEFLYQLNLQLALFKTR